MTIKLNIIQSGSISRSSIQNTNNRRFRIWKNKCIIQFNKEQKILIVLDDMIADMINNKKLNSKVTDLFIRGRKLNISLVFITQSYLKVPKDVRLNTTHFFITTVPNKRELQQIALNYSSDISSKDFVKIHKKNVLLNHILF